MKKNKLAHIIVTLYFLMLAAPVFANFGESCSGLPAFPADNYLKTETAYGHLIGNIDMTTYVTGACDPTTNEITFCFQMPAGIMPRCSPPVTIPVGDSRRLGDISTNPALGGNDLLKDLVLSAVRMDDFICLMMATSRGQLPVICKTTTIVRPPEIDKEPDCKNIGNSCFNGHTKSQSALNFSGMAVHCLKETLDKVFYERSTCVASGNQELKFLAPFPIFQESLKNSIRAALILYVMFYGFKVVLSGEYADLNNIAAFILKFLFIAYFAVGLGPTFFREGKETTRNGMVEFGLPLLSQIAPDLAGIVFGAGGAQGLCSFDPVKYEPGYEFYAVWDAIDCRIGYYMGMKLMYDTASILNGASSSTYDPPGSGGSSTIDIGTPGSKGIDILNSDDAFRFFAVLFGFFMGGNIIILVSGLAFAIIFISIIFHFLTSYLVCLITLYVMAYISPIFITMALFDRTKAYFDSWLKITLSCVLQPAMLAGFIALLLTMYDSAIYKNCQFKRHDYSIEGQNFSTFELRVPDSDPAECRKSAGYKVLHYYEGQGWDTLNLILFHINFITDTFDLMVELLYVLIFTIIFYHFSKSMSQFAADITAGPIMSSVTAGPTRIVDAVKKAADYAMAASSGKKPSVQDMGKQMSENMKPKSKGEGGKEGEGSAGEAKESKDSIGGGSGAGGGGGGDVGGISGGGGGGK